jgi:hypothetical protein
MSTDKKPRKGTIAHYRERVAELANENAALKSAAYDATVTPCAGRRSSATGSARPKSSAAASPPSGQSRPNASATGRRHAPTA